MLLHHARCSLLTDPPQSFADLAGLTQRMMSAPAPLRVRVCRKGADPRTDAVTITIDASVFPRFGKGSTGWGNEVLAVLKEAAAVFDIGHLGIWYAANEEVEELPQTRVGWSTVTSMGPTDVIVVGQTARDCRVDEGSVCVLPDDEQNHRRLFDLHFGVVRDALQEVSCAPQLMRALAHSLSHITDNLSDSRYSEYHQSHRDSLSQ
jgi:hypothetical protein